MDAKNAEDARALLAELAPLLFELLAASEWGRLLVKVDPVEQGDQIEGYRLGDLQIEDVVGDEGKVEAAMKSEEVFPLLPVLLEACEALCELEGVELADVEGGTFLRNPTDDTFGFLPGLVRVPSEGFGALIAERRAGASERQRALTERLGARDHFEVDLLAGSITFFEQKRPVARASTVLLGSFSDRTRTWAWAWGNASLPPALQAQSADVCDRFARRDLWELTSPQFATDLGTCWELAALMATEENADGVYRIPQGHRHVFLLLKGAELIPG